MLLNKLRASTYQWSTVRLSAMIAQEARFFTCPTDNLPLTTSNVIKYFPPDEKSHRKPTSTFAHDDKVLVQVPALIPILPELWVTRAS